MMLQTHTNIIPRLDLHPAWGFETTERYLVAKDQRITYLNSINNSYRNFNLWWGMRMEGNNIAKIASYVPGLNFITAIGRYYLNSHEASKDPVKKAISARHCDRAVAEFFLGPLLIIPDLIITAKEHLEVKEYNRQKTSTI